MKLLLAALAVTFAIAVTASVFAVWPAVADAPWENDAVVVTETTDVRCEGALSFRDGVIRVGEYSGGFGEFGGEGNPGGLRDYDSQLAKAENEIRRYC